MKMHLIELIEIAERDGVLTEEFLNYLQNLGKLCQTIINRHYIKITEATEYDLRLLNR